MLGDRGHLRAMRLLPFAAAAPACIVSPHLAARLAEYRLLSLCAGLH